MHGLREYFARLVVFCADDVGRTWIRGIERDAQHGVVRICRHQVPDPGRAPAGSGQTRQRARDAFPLPSR